jgi:hypothetical protein
MKKFRDHYPGWDISISLDDIIVEIAEQASRK